MTKDEALDLALEALEESQTDNDTMEFWDRKTKAITAIKQARALDKKAENARELGLDYESANGTQVSKVWWDGEKLMAKPIPLEDIYQPAPVQEPVDTLIAAWQTLEETSGHVLDVGDVEGRMHMSVIRSAWEQMDSLVREMWDERGRP
jgi:hypothetical protein